MCSISECAFVSPETISCRKKRPLGQNRRMVSLACREGSLLPAGSGAAGGVFSSIHVAQGRGGPGGNRDPG